MTLWLPTTQYMLSRISEVAFYLIILFDLECFSLLKQHLEKINPNGYFNKGENLYSACRRYLSASLFEEQIRNDKITAFCLYISCIKSITQQKKSIAYQHLPHFKKKSKKTLILRFIKLKKLDTSSEHQKQRDTHEHTSTSNVRSLSSRKMTRSRSLVSLETRDMVAKPPKPPNLLCSSSMATSLCLFLSGGTRRSLHRRSHPKCSPRMSPPLLYALSALILSAGNRGCSSGCSSGALTLLMFPQTEH